MKKRYYTFNDLLKIMERLRSPKGCPWDRRQTHKTLLPYLTEEVGEFKKAVRSGDTHDMADELGDVLLQIVFHSQLGKEKRAFTIRDVIQNICRKLIRRHPHVFGKSKATTIKEITKNWNEIKAREKKRRKRNRRVTMGVPSSRGAPEQAIPSNGLRQSPRSAKARRRGAKRRGNLVVM